MFKIDDLDLRRDPPLFKLRTLSGQEVKGLWYKENLRPVSKLNKFLNQIVDQCVKKGVKQIKIKLKNKVAVWKNLEDYMIGSTKK